MHQESDRALLHRLAPLMGWPQWDWSKGGDAEFAASVTYWADWGYEAGLSVYRPGDVTGRVWNPLTSPADAIELAEYVSRADSPHTLEVARTYERTWREGPPGWAALFVSRYERAEGEGDQVEERCLHLGDWAPTFARAVSLAAIKAQGQ